jgi:YjbE family integral membrane protein
MELFSPEFFSALFAIILIDLVLAGDNALVIGLAARKLPPAVQKKAVLWGTFGAIAIRTVMTLCVVWLLKIPGLMGIGGALLVFVAYKLLKPQDEDAHGGLQAGDTFWAAMKTIIIADAVMGVDNVLAVAGAAHGSFLLVVIGLIISVPIVVWGSTLVIKLVDRFPSVMYIGAGVLAWTAAKMMMNEPMLKPYLQGDATPWIVYAVVIGGVLGAGYLRNQRKPVKPLADIAHP